MKHSITTLTSLLLYLLSTPALQAMSLDECGEPASKRQRVEPSSVELKIAVESKAQAETKQASGKQATQEPFKLDKLPIALQSKICEHVINPWDHCEALIVDEVVATVPEVAKRTNGSQIQEVYSLTPSLFVHIITTRETNTDVYVWSILDDNTLRCINTFQLNYSSGTSYDDTRLVFLLKSKELNADYFENWYFEIWDALKSKPISQYILQPGEWVLYWRHDDNKITVITQRRFFILDIHDIGHPHVEKEKKHDSVIEGEVTIMELPNGSFILHRHDPHELHAYDANFTHIKCFDIKKNYCVYVMQMSDTELLTFVDSEPGLVRIWDLNTFTCAQEICTKTPEDTNLHKLSNEAFTLDGDLIYTKNKKTKQYELLKTKFPNGRTLNVSQEISSKHFSIFSFQPSLAVVTIMNDQVKVCSLQTNNSACQITDMRDIDQNSFLAVDTNQRVHLFKIRKESLNELYKLNPTQQQILPALIQRLHRAKDMPRETIADIKQHAHDMCINHDLLIKMPTAIQTNLKNYFGIKEEDRDAYLQVKKETDFTDNSSIGTETQGAGSSSSASMPYTQSELDAEMEAIYS